MLDEDTTIHQMNKVFRAEKIARRQVMKRLTTMGMTAAGIGAMVAASSSSAATASLQVHTADHAAKHMQLHDQHLTHQSQGNASALHNDYAEHAVVEDSLHAQPFVGRPAILARKNLILAAASEAAITVTNRMVHGNQVTAEWVATGRHTGDLPGLPASGRPFTLRGVTVVIREKGKIVREALYYNVSELHSQLR